MKDKFKAQPTKFKFFKILFDRAGINVYVIENDVDVFTAPRGQYHLRRNPARKVKHND